MTQKEAVAKAPESRVKRTPIGARNLLTVKGKDPNYEYRIVNDEADRITQLQDQGYELVEADAVEVGDKRVSQGTTLGSKKMFSVGQGVKAFVMKIKKEYYDEDQKSKQVHVNALESSIKPKTSDGDYGKVELSRD